MKRTHLLIGILILVVMAGWIVTYFFFHRLPPRIPIHISIDGSSSYGPRGMFFVFPVLTTIISLACIALMPLRRKFTFPGRKLIQGLPDELTNPIYDRTYEIILLVVIFTNMLLTYLQAQIAFVALGQSRGINLLTFFAVLGIMALYVGYNIWNLYRTSKGTRQYYEEELKDRE